MDYPGVSFWPREKSEPKMRKVKNSRRGGWSLIETVIVLAIIGILSTIGFSYVLRARPHARLEQAELRLVGVLAKARNLAISEELATKAVFNLESEEYWIEQQDRETLAWINASHSYTLPEEVHFAAVGGVTFSGNEVRFTPRGTLMSGGSIKVVNSLGETSTLTGSLATGRFPITGGNLR